MNKEFKHVDVFSGDQKYILCDSWRLNKYHAASTSCSYQDEEDNLIKAIDSVNSCEEFYLWNAIDFIYQNLDNRQAYVVEMILWEGQSCAVIAKELNLSRQRVHAIYKSSLRRLKKLLIKNPKLLMSMWTGGKYDWGKTNKETNNK